MLAFELSPNVLNFEETIDRIITIAEQTKSSIGGGSDGRQGEFYIETSSQFEQAHLMEIVGILLPATSSLTINPVNPARKSRRRTTAISSNKHSNGKSNGARRATPPRRPRKQRVKV